jgi:hypothetical protein
VWYPQWAGSFGSDHTEQGDLFEALKKDSLEKLFPGWTTHRTGWTPNNPVNLADAASRVATLLGELPGNLEQWANRRAHEEGLDIVFFRSLDDERVGVPVFLLQCASGSNWRHKLKSPDLETWTKLVDFAAKPKKAFSMPFALSDNREFSDLRQLTACFLTGIACSHRVS